MKPIVCALLLLVSTVIRSRVSLQLEIVALRHQLAVYQRTTKRPQINSGIRVFPDLRNQIGGTDVEKVACGERDKK